MKIETIILNSSSLSNLFNGSSVTLLNSSSFGTNIGIDNIVWKYRYSSSAYNVSNDSYFDFFVSNLNNGFSSSLYIFTGLNISSSIDSIIPLSINTEIFSSSSLLLKYSGSIPTTGNSTVQIDIYYDTQNVTNTDPGFTFDTKTSFNAPVSIGDNVEARSTGSFALGLGSIANNNYSHAEGSGSLTSGLYSHAEGSGTHAKKSGSHAEGQNAIADGNYSHAEGSNTTTTGVSSHAEGKGTLAIGNYSHAEGDTTIAFGESSHASGLGTIASGSNQAAVGTYNRHNNTTDLFVIGNGVNDGNRSDILNVSSTSVRITGSLNVSGSITGSLSGSITGSLFGTSSWATNATTASYVLNAVSSSFATSASNALTASSTPNALITASVSSNTLTFTKGNGSTFNLTVNTGSGGGGTPGGSNTQIQFNSGSTFSGSGNFTYNYQSQGLQQGLNITASGQYSHAEGYYSQASGQYSHAEGEGNTSYGYSSHAEGNNTIASGSYSHTEGADTIANGQGSHAEGSSTDATGLYSHAEGLSTVSTADHSHAEGANTDTQGIASHAEGFYTRTSGQYSHAEGLTFLIDSNTFINMNGLTDVEFDFGLYSVLSSDQSSITVAGDQTGAASFPVTLTIFTITDSTYNIEVNFSYYPAVTVDSANYDSGNNWTVFSLSGAEPDYFNVIGNTILSSNGTGSHAEGLGTLANGNASHAEGYTTQATGLYSHAEGYFTTASGLGSHAEGLDTDSQGFHSHTEGYATNTIGQYSHAEGYATNAIGQYSHAEGANTVAYGDGSHAGGLYTIASGSYQTVIGQYNKRGNTTDLFVIGGGSDDADIDRKDILNISTTNITMSGSVNISGNLIFSSPTAPGFNGEIVRFGAGTLTTGQLYFLSSSGTWSLSNANSTGSSTGMLGIAVGSSPTTNGLLIRGFAASSSYTQSTGSILYMATSSGLITSTSPSSSNHVVRVIGYKTTLSNTIYFDPDKTWVTLA